MPQTPSCGLNSMALHAYDENVRGAYVLLAASILVEVSVLGVEWQPILF